ncbi:hypothetical protein C8J56DRAFT_1049765 [Mycena floridula]|nr:hypothetical protein C8J56DRAFT_1049765 [Mycena floridula]
MSLNLLILGTQLGGCEGITADRSGATSQGPDSHLTSITLPASTMDNHSPSSTSLSDTQPSQISSNPATNRITRSESFIATVKQENLVQVVCSGSVSSSTLLSGSNTSGNLNATNGSPPITLTSPILPSTANSTQNPTSSSSSVLIHTTNNIGVIVGIVLGVIAVLGAIFGILVIRRRRRRVITLTVSPYEPSSSENIRARSRLPRAVFNWRKRHFPINETANSTEFLSEKGVITPDPLFSDDAQTERERNLQAHALDTERQLVESEAASSNLPDISPEFARALIAEIIRLNAETQVLRVLNRPDWEAPADVAPPSYPHSEISSL